MLSVILILLQAGCNGCTEEQSTEAYQNVPQRNYTHEFGGNRSYNSNIDNDYGIEPAETISDIRVRIIDQSVYVDAKNFDDVDEALNYVYRLKNEDPERSVTINLRYSKAEALVKFKEGLDQKGILYKTESS